MNIRQLQIFITVADCEKMSLAAEKLFISQPSVSQTIAEIEQRYQVRLFERLSKKLYITPAGERLLTYARHIVGLFDEMELQLQQDSTHTQLRIGATVTIGSCLMGGLVSEFIKEYPSVQTQVFVDNTAAIEQKLLKSELDCAIVEGTVNSDDLLSQAACTDQLVAVCAPDYPLPNEVISLKTLTEHPLIAREEGSGTRAQFEQLLNSQGLTMPIGWVSSNVDAIKSALLSGLGVSVLSRRLVEAQLQAGQLREIRVVEALPTRDFLLIYHKNKFVSPALEGFFTLTRKQLSQV